VIPTTNLLRHALAGALTSFAAALALFPAHAQAMTFAGAMSALLVNLDRYEMPEGRRTPFGHSVLAWALWSYAASLILAVLAFARVVDFASSAPVAIGVAIGYATHLALDSFSGEGVYLFPNGRFTALAALPDDCERQWAGWGRAALPSARK
jgi:hypothetical protein